MKPEIFIKGFETGWFSHEFKGENDDICCNCSLFGEPLTESAIMLVRRLTDKPVKLYCHKNQSLMLYYSLYEVKKTDKEIIKRLLLYPEIAKKMFNIEMIACNDIPEAMWFAVWGDKREECFGSKGDGEYLIK